MSEQPEALRLADRLERRRLTHWVHATGETPRASGYVVDQDCAEAAAELRRLHAVNQELMEALKVLLPGAESMGWDTDKARAAIAKAEGQA
jgi:hypothetical protein